MNEKIELLTKLDENVYVSPGRAPTTIEAEWNLGPRNLMKAIEALRCEIRNNWAEFGGVGAGESWLRIAGEDVSYDDLKHVCKVSTARKEIELITSGNLASYRDARLAAAEVRENALIEKMMGWKAA